jgi:hypothetical protein
MTDTRVVFLFGSGASHGAGGTDNLPPLSTDLYSELRAYFTQSWGRISGNLDAAFRERFEVGMQAACGAVPELPLLLNHMGRYFAKFRIQKREKNLYFQLIKRFRLRFTSGEFLIATTNYDCLIEQACPPSNPSYWSKPEGSLRILKLNGSCNFLADANYQLSFTVGCNVNAADVNVPLRAVHPDQALKEFENEQNYPALGVYSIGGSGLIGEQQIRQIQGGFQQAVRDASLVIVVGAAPCSEDPYVWDHLAATEGELLLVGDKTSCENWMVKSRTPKPARWLAQTFKEGFDDLCRELK